ncbi:histidine kinase [uncultured Polaribacter sp.]|uniref:sensor histidine kinase n=1 Tax=uncultured Polaribacter sp. TaxID=174711 RepID=UPI002637F35C|nr:histidine kinase [uncultured Polaribacter sp.]
MKKSNKKFNILGVNRKELLLFIGFYIFFAFFYRFTLWVNRGGYDDPNDNLFNIILFFDDAGLKYVVEFLLTIPIWYLLFRKLNYLSLQIKLLLHFILLPIYVFSFFNIYYVVSDFIGFEHLKGKNAIWDIYLPSLFYLLQFGIMHSYNYHLENKRKIVLEGALRTAALKSELSALKAQLNPHFLYNVFNTISASVPAEQEKTRNMIAELSDLFRYQLKASQVEKVTLREELAFVNKYLKLEKERFQERLTVNIDVDESLLNEKVPPMLLQPLVENSIKHGLSSLIEGGEITIKIKEKEEKLFFEITDTGIGIKNKENVFNKGIGLTNTKLRLEKMYKSTLNLSDNLPRGLKVSFEL